jgi:hypothetical protein
MVLPMATSSLGIPSITESTESSSDVTEIGLYDILCGRDSNAFNNVGNRRFRITVSLALERYMKAPNRKDKSIVVKSVVALVHENGGRFMRESRRKDGIVTFIELNKKRSHEKAGHALRDMTLIRNATRKHSSSLWKNRALSKSADSTTTTIMSNLSSQSQAAFRRLLDVTVQINEHYDRMNENVVSTDPPFSKLMFNEATSEVEIDPLSQEQRQQINRNYEANVEEIFVDQWDDWSDLTADESVFDDLVRLVAESNTTEIGTDVDTLISPSGRMISLWIGESDFVLS